MDKTTIKTLSDDELSHLNLIVLSEQDARFSAAQKAAEKERKNLFQKEKKRMKEIENILNKNVKVEWNGIKLTLIRDYLINEEYPFLSYIVKTYSGPGVFFNEDRELASEEVRQIAPELVKGDMKLVKEYYGLREKVETTEN